MKTFSKIVVGAALVYFFSWFIVYKTGINTLAIQSEDTLPAAVLPFAILRDGSLYLDWYYDMFLGSYPHPDDRDYAKDLVPFYLRRVGTQVECPGGLTPQEAPHICPITTHYVSAFPIVTPILALPVYALPVMLNIFITWDLVYVLSHLAAAVIVAFSGGFLYILVKNHFALSEHKSLVLTLVYLFCTINYSLSSQSLWQHGTVQLFLILALVFLYRKNFFWYSFMFCFAVLSRPTAVFIFPFLVVLTLFYIKQWGLSLWKAVVTALAGSVVPLLFFVWYNAAFYESIANQGYASQIGSEWLSKLPEGFLGIWLSPSKGLLIYSPVFVFALVGLWLGTKNKSWRTNPTYLLFGLMVLTHTLIMGKWKHWYGGYSYGYRMAADVLPLLILLLIPYLQSELFEKTKRWFVLSAGISFFVQLGGIVFFDGVWHAAYDRGFEDTGWLWSIKDCEFMFNARRILVKLGLLQRACPKCLPG